MYKFLIKSAMLGVMAAPLGGCAPALVGGLIYKSTKSDEEKATFVTNPSEDDPGA
jgi:myo-inositol-1-phosphate synthase